MSEKKVREPIQLPNRIHFNEFVSLNTKMDTVERAGFKVFCKGKEWMRQAEWENALKEYSGDTDNKKDEKEVQE